MPNSQKQQSRHALEAVQSVYRNCCVVGKGAYGSVYRANKPGTDDVVAVKVVPKENSGIPQSVVREILCLKSLQHPNVLAIREVVVTVAHVFLELEFVPQDLATFLRGSRCRPSLRRELMRQLLAGVMFCHGRGIMHRDIKPQNILVSPEPHQLKIADFGMSTYQGFVASCQDWSVEIVTLWYRAPELLRHTRYGRQIDIWSVGCVMAELILGHALYPGQTKEEMLLLIENTPKGSTKPNLQKLKGKATEEEIQFIAKLLVCEPENRLDASELLKDPFFE